MRKYVEAFMKEQLYPRQAREELITIYDRIMADSALCDILCRAVDIYENDAVCDFEEVLALCEELEQSSLMHEYAVNLIFFICLTPHLKERYKKAGIGTDIWFDTVSDLKYKMIECKDINNIWGIADKTSLTGIFELKRFTLGRLQFETVPFGDVLPDFEYKKDAISLAPDTRVINVHVPRMLKALDDELCGESYAVAAEFFGSEFAGKPTVFVCQSWMLYPEYKEVFKEGMDIQSFASGFEIIAVSSDRKGEYPDMWQVFDMEYTGRAEDYPENTMLRKRFKEYLVNGGKTGRGIGIKVL